MNEINKRDRRAQERRELSGWQRGAVGLLALGAATNMIWYALHLAQARELERLETKYNAAVAVERDAVAAYGALITWVNSEREARQAQAEAYEAIGKYQYIGECTVTYYCCEAYPHICGTGDGVTASGLPVAPGVVAVDPDVIPLGSTVIIDGTSYLAADTGVEGLHVDVAVPTHEEALELGTKTEQVWVSVDSKEE